MPDDRNYRIRAPLAGMVTIESPESAEGHGTVFHAKNVSGRVQRGTYTFGSREKFGDATGNTYELPTVPPFWCIGGVVITIGGAGVCASDQYEPEAGYDTSKDYYRGRRIKRYENLVLYSRIDNYDDFDLGAPVEDHARAVAIQTNESPGISGAVTAVVPYNDRNCWIFTTRGVWLLIGDPVNMNLHMKSYNIGTFSQTSADVTDVGEVYFLSREGLCSCGLEGRVNKISEQVIPGSFSETDGLVAYDDLRDRVYVFTEDFSCQVDMRSKAFWEIEVAALPIGTVKSSNGELIFVDAGGAAKSFIKGEVCETDWSVIFGPYEMCANFRTAVLREVQSYLSEGSCGWEAITSWSAESCLAEAKAFLGHTGRFSATTGKSYIKRPRDNGTHYCIVMQGNGAFGMESFRAMSTMTGRGRV